MRKSYKNLLTELEEVKQKTGKDYEYFPMWLLMPHWSPIKGVHGRSVALLLSHLVRLQVQYHPDAEKEGGWFPCPIHDLENGTKGRESRLPGLRMPSSTQTRAFRLLEGADLIRRKLIGIPPTRHVWVNHDLLQKYNGRFQVRWESMINEGVKEMKGALNPRKKTPKKK